MRTILISLMLSVFIGNAFAQVAIDQVARAPVYIDVRSWAESQVDSIDGDVRIHVSEIVEGVNSAFPDKDTAIHLYCAVGGRAGRAAEQLRLAGYTNVHNAGGIDDVRKTRSIRD